MHQTIHRRKMRALILLTALSSLLAAASAVSNSPMLFGQVDHRQQLTPPSFYRRNTAHAVRGGEEEGGFPEAQVDPEAVDPSAAVEVSADGTEKEASQFGKKMANLKERTLPAVLMLGSVSALTYYTREKGLMGLTLVLQMGMYEEMTNVVGGKLQPFMKWWWFLTSSLAFNAPRLLPAKEATKIAAASYGMAIFGIVSTVIRLQVASADAAAFREFMRQTAISAISLVSRFQTRRQVFRIVCFLSL
jgi:hypothetical protein